jgi:hypothetical protein
MGGPFWARKDEGAWSIPKGEHPPSEDARAAARREFAEGARLPRARRRVARPRHRPVRPQGHRRVRAGGRPRRRAHRQQHLRARMAAALRPARSRSPRSTGRPGSTWRPPAARS